MARFEIGNEPRGTGHANEQRTEQRPYTVLQLFFMTRLQEVAEQQAKLGALVNRGDWRLRLLDKAIYSTYRDCVEQGVGADAQALLRARQRAEN